MTALLPGARREAGATPSSAGARFRMAASSLHARHHPRHLGPRRRVSVDGHVSDQGSQDWVDVITCQVRESVDVLNGLVFQEVLPIQEHDVETHACTELVFGLFMLLGYRFAPRRRDLPHQVLYRARKDAECLALEPVSRHTIRAPLIVWRRDDVNQLAASLRDGRVTPSLVVTRLQAMRHQNPL